MFRKNIYSLKSIERVITYIPTLFLLLLSVFIVVISYMVIKSKEKKEIEAIKEKAFIRYEYKERNKLYSFVSNIRKDVNRDIISAKTKLQKVVYTSIGQIERLGLEGKNFKTILQYLKDIQDKEGVYFMLFSGDALQVYLGKRVVSYLRYLIFGSRDKQKYNKLVLEYIYSQGEDNFQYWIDDIRKTVRVSFFDKLYIENRPFFLGAFSTINNLRSLTKHRIISNLKKNQNGDYIWLYDIITSTVYNYYGKNKSYSASYILSKKEYDKKYWILKYYSTNENENERFKNYTYLMDRFKFVISIEYSYKNAYIGEKESIDSIKEYYSSFFVKLVVVVIVITLLLIVSSLLFANYVKDVFKRYNRRLHLRKESLQHWKKRFELAIIASNDGMWDIDFNKNSIYFSKKWLEISGYDRGDIKNFGDWFGLIHKEDRDSVQVLFDEILDGKREHLICEYRLKTKNSGYKWILARGKIFRNENDGFNRMLMMSMDIDKNKRMSKELLNVEMLVEDGSIAILKWKNDSKLSVEFVSNSIKKYGYFRSSFEKGVIPYIDIVYKEDREFLLNNIKEAIRLSRKSFVVIYRIVDNGGKIRWIYSRVLLIKDDLSQVTHLYGYIHDITKLKNVQEELKVKVKEEIEKNRQKDAFIVQQNKLASMGSMLGSIAHQWRQPLNNVQLILHFIRDNCSNDQMPKEMLKEYINRAKTQIEYMSQTIDDFRDFYQPSKHKNYFNLEQSFKKILRLVEDQIGGKDIEIDFFCKGDIWMESYENELKQAVLNILNNAKDAIIQRREKEQFDAVIKIVVKKVEGGKVKNMFEKFDSKKNFAIISISNNGGEIKEDIIDRIFEPYFTTKFESQGTGIGLYMTKVIVEKNLEGKISVKNIKNGVDFELILPIKE